MSLDERFKIFLGEQSQARACKRDLKGASCGFLRFRGRVLVNSPVLSATTVYEYDWCSKRINSYLSKVRRPPREIEHNVVLHL